MDALSQGWNTIPHVHKVQMLMTDFHNSHIIDALQNELAHDRLPPYFTGLAHTFTGYNGSTPILHTINAQIQSILKSHAVTQPPSSESIDDAKSLLMEGILLNDHSFILSMLEPILTIWDGHQPVADLFRAMAGTAHKLHLSLRKEDGPTRGLDKVGELVFFAEWARRQIPFADLWEELLTSEDVTVAEGDLTVAERIEMTSRQSYDAWWDKNITNPSEGRATSRKRRQAAIETITGLQQNNLGRIQGIVFDHLDRNVTYQPPQ